MLKHQMLEFDKHLISGCRQRIFMARQQPQLIIRNWSVATYITMYWLGQCSMLSTEGFINYTFNGSPHSLIFRYKDHPLSGLPWPKPLSYLLGCNQPPHKSDPGAEYHSLSLYPKVCFRSKQNSSVCCLDI